MVGLEPLKKEAISYKEAKFKQCEEEIDELDGNILELRRELEIMDGDMELLCVTHESLWDSLVNLRNKL